MPLGETVAALGLAFSAVLIPRMNQRELAVLAATLIVGLVHWWARRTERTERAERTEKS